MALPMNVSIGQRMTELFKRAISGPRCEPFLRAEGLDTTSLPRCDFSPPALFLAAQLPPAVGNALRYNMYAHLSYEVTCRLFEEKASIEERSLRAGISYSSVQRMRGISSRTDAGQDAVPSARIDASVFAVPAGDKSPLRWYTSVDATALLTPALGLGGVVEAMYSAPHPTVAPGPPDWALGPSLTVYIPKSLRYEVSLTIGRMVSYGRFFPARMDGSRAQFGFSHTLGIVITPEIALHAALSFRSIEYTGSVADGRYAMEISPAEFMNFRVGIDHRILFPESAAPFIDWGPAASFRFFPFRNAAVEVSIAYMTYAFDRKESDERIAVGIGRYF
ncbi:MAG: hypothetical protein QHI48_04070 [Bacteroidota bacterium]|nr:hypothetical protein [Bacteroidota bacterium]